MTMNNLNDILGVFHTDNQYKVNLTYNFMTCLSIHYNLITLDKESAFGYPDREFKDVIGLKSIIQNLGNVRNNWNSAIYTMNL